MKKKIMILIIILITGIVITVSKEQTEIKNSEKYNKLINERIENKESMIITVRKSDLGWKDASAFRTYYIGVMDKSTLKWIKLSKPVYIELKTSFNINKELETIKIRKDKDNVYKGKSL